MAERRGLAPGAGARCNGAAGAAGPRRTARRRADASRTALAQTMRTTGTIIGRRRVRSPTNLPKRLAGVAAQHLDVVGAVAQRLRHRGRHHLAGLAEQLLGLGRVHPAPGLDHRRAAERALLAVDRDHGHDHALLGQLLAVAQHAVLDVAHRAVHVDVAGRAPARRGRCPWRRAGSRRRPRTAAPWPGRCPWRGPGGRGAPCGGTRRARGRSTPARSPTSACAAPPGGRGR